MTDCNTSSCLLITFLIARYLAHYTNSNVVI